MIILKTPFYIEVLDAAGKKATGYLGAVGAGETLGSELVDGWTNNPSYPFETWTPGAGTNITQAVNTGIGSEYGIAYKSLVGAIELGQLTKIVATLNIASGDFGGFGIGVSNHPQNGPEIFKILTTTIGVYKTIIDSVLINDMESMVIFTNTPIDFALSNFSYKRVTHPPATAVHIVSSHNGTIRDWASIESGFDPNTIASWKIYYAANSELCLSSDGSTFNRGDFTEDNAFFWSSIDLSRYAQTSKAMYTITEIEDAIISTLKSSDMGAYCKKIDSFQIEGGDLEEQIRILSGNLPSVLIQYSESPSFEHSMSSVQDEDVIFSILVCSQSLRGAGEARRNISIGTYKMLYDLRKALSGKNCGLDIDPLLPQSAAAEVNTKSFSAYSIRFKTRCRHTL